MSGGFPIARELSSAVDNGTTTATTMLTTITGNASANTKGSWVQLTASLTVDAAWLLIQIATPASGAGGQYSIDIGIGGSGSEVVIVHDLVMKSVASGAAHYMLPVAIPAGTRVAARCQNTIGADTFTVGVTAFDSAFQECEGCAGVDAVGFSSGTTKGTVLTGSGANGKGSWGQLVASSAVDYEGFALSVTGDTNTGSFLVDIGVGGAGSEVAILPSLYFGAATTTNTWPLCTPYFPIPIPAGTRIAGRCQNSAGSGKVDVVLYGVYR